MSISLLESTAFERQEIVPLTVEQYHGMIAAGILEEGEPIELLDGLLARRNRGEGMTTNPVHALVVSKLNLLLTAALGSFGCHVRIQSPVTLPPRDEPEPDLAIVQGLPADFALRHPGPAEVTCVIEVAGTSLDRDRTTKKRIYAAAGIPQYLIVNLTGSRIELLRRAGLRARSVPPAGGAHTGEAEIGLLLPASRRLRVSAADCLP